MEALTEAEAEPQREGKAPLSEGGAVLLRECPSDAVAEAVVDTEAQPEALRSILPLAKNVALWGDEGEPPGDIVMEGEAEGVPQWEELMELCGV